MDAQKNPSPRAGAGFRCVRASCPRLRPLAEIETDFAKFRLEIAKFRRAPLEIAEPSPPGRRSEFGSSEGRFARPRACGMGRRSGNMMSDKRRIRWPGRGARACDARPGSGGRGATMPGREGGREPAMPGREAGGEGLRCPAGKWGARACDARPGGGGRGAAMSGREVGGEGRRCPVGKWGAGACDARPGGGGRGPAMPGREAGRMIGKIRCQTSMDPS